MTCKPFKRLYVTVLVYLLFKADGINAQSSIKNSFKNTYVEFGYNYGKIIKNYPRFPQTDFSETYELNIGYQSAGNYLWEDFYKYPQVGFKFFSGKFGNDEILGKAMGLLPEIGFYSNKAKRIQFMARMGLGAAYFNKPFHHIENPENILIGSKVTAAAFAAVGAEFNWLENLHGNFSVSAYHFSNSHYQLPNLGLNQIAIRAGVKYYIGGSVFDPVLNANIPPLDRRINFNVRLGLGINEYGGTLGPTGGAKFPIYLTSLFFTKHVSFINKISGGADLAYNTGTRDFIQNSEFYENKHHLKSSTAILFVGHEFVLSHLSLVTQAGYFLFNPVPYDLIKDKPDTSISRETRLKTKITAKLGLQYYLYNANKVHKNQWFIGAYVKTNLGQAHFFETGIGYTFK